MCTAGNNSGPTGPYTLPALNSDDRKLLTTSGCRLADCILDEALLHTTSPYRNPMRKPARMPSVRYLEYALSGCPTRCSSHTYTGIGVWIWSQLLTASPGRRLGALLPARVSRSAVYGYTPAESPEGQCTSKLLPLPWEYPPQNTHAGDPHP